MDLITSHLNADFDCLGAMVAVSRLYPGAMLAFPGSHEKGLREFLEKHPNLPVEITRSKDVPLDEVTRLILVDCRHSSRIGRFAEALGRDGVEVHIYDHHPDEMADIVPDGGVIRDCGSSSTIVSLLLMEKGITVSPEEATIIMLGIHEDTGSLTFSTTSVDDYTAAAWLLRQGASLKTVSDSLTQELNAEQVSLLNDLLTSLQTISVNGVDVSIAQASVDYYVGDLAVLAHMIRDMENLECLFVLVAMGKRVYLIARSRIPEVDVGAVLREFGGGGHPVAASATVKDLTIIQVLSRLDHVLRLRINPRRLARDIMSAPVKTLPVSTTLGEARELLTKYNVNAMPVMGKGKVVGIISRKIVEKALYHNLGDLPVSEYMHTEFMRAAPETPISEIQEYIVGRNRRFVPVFDGERLVGAVTRTDLLRYMYTGLRMREDAFDLFRQELPERHRRLDHLLNRNLPKRVSQLLHDLGEAADELDLPIYAVGGFVRDLILRTDNADIDVTVEGDGILFAETFARNHGCRVKSHEKFGTAVIIFNDGFKIDVASTRLEYYETPGALPTVERSSLKMDLYRRDFTINTLAVCLNHEDFGLLVDYFGGLRDLSDKVIRVLHNLSFVEDPTRVFRAIRFEQRLNFRISPHTENLIRNAVKMSFLDKLGGKRFLTELVYIFRESDPLRSVERMASLGLLAFIHPKLHFDQRLKHVITESRNIITWFDLLYLGKEYEKWVVYFLAVTDGLDHDDFLSVCARLSVSEHYREKLYEMRREGTQTLVRLESFAGRGTLRNSDIYFTLHELPVEMLLFFMTKTVSDHVRRAISVFFTHLEGVRLHITGTDLKDIGVPPGPLYRKLLDAVLAARLNGEVESREDELKILQKKYAAVAKMQQR